MHTYRNSAIKAQLATAGVMQMLVKTLRVGFDDIAHFSFLFSIIVGGYIFLALAQFAHFRTEFQDFESSFRTLWEMLLGNMMSSGATPSMAWTNNPLLFFFQMTYIILVFLIMLNVSVHPR